MKFGLDLPGGFWEDVWSVDNGRTDGGRACLYHKLIYEFEDPGELKMAQSVNHYGLCFFNFIIIIIIIIYIKSCI